MSNKPEMLPIPSAYSHVFINSAFYRNPARFTTLFGEEVVPDVDALDRLSENHFDLPGSIHPEIIAPLKSMSELTFERLFSILKPRIHNAPFVTKIELAEIAAKEDARFEELHGKFQPSSLDQLCSYFMFQAKMTANVRWVDIASLYNESSPDQQEAIYQYFHAYEGFDIGWLIDLTGKDIELPECLQETYESRVIAGKTELFSEAQKTWLRDDCFAGQYRIEFSSNLTKGFRFLIAAAPTLSQAIAKATAHTTQSEFYKADFWHCEIVQSGLVVAKAEVKGIDADKTIAQKPPERIKLKWVFDELGAENDCAEKIKLGANRNEIDEMLKNTTPINKNTFVKTVFAVETALGLRWSKAYMLEDALGL